MSTHVKVSQVKWPLAAASIVALLSGCASFPRPLTEPAIVTSTDASVMAAVQEGDVPTSMDLDAGFSAEDVFMLRPINESGPVPDRLVKGITITESGIFDALRLIGRDAGLTLNIEGGVNGSERFGSTSAFDVHGNLKEVLEELSESMGFFYSIRKNTLFIQQEQQFVVELPPALSEDNASGLTNTLQYLGAKDTYIDRMNRSLVFKTNRKSLAKIEGYLQKIRETRSLIIYDVNIFQVDLKDNSDTGIQWNKLGWSGTPGALNGVSNVSGAGTGTTGTSNTVANVIGNAITATKSTLGMGLVLSSARFSIDSLINFLQTQGSVKAISRPRLAVISGTKGTLRVGQVTTFISKVGTNFSTAVNQVTTETKDLKTGLELGLFGDFSDNTVYTRVGMSISEITRLEKVTALGTDFTLPQTADRDINTVIRSRPGDMILMGGITIDRDTINANGGIAGAGKSKEVTRSELVLTLRTKVVYFRGKGYKTAVAEKPSSQLIGVTSKPVSLPTSAAVTQPPTAPAPAVIISSGSFASTKAKTAN